MRKNKKFCIIYTFKKVIKFLLKPTILIPISGIILIIFSVYFIWYLPYQEVSYSKLQNVQIINGNRNIIKKHEAYEKYQEILNKKRATNATIIGGLGGFILIIIQIIRTYKFSNQVQEERRSNINRETLDQYVKAVEQLKDDNIAIRLGGIYSLEKIMNSEDKEIENYHNTIIELFCAYVREKRRLVTTQIEEEGYSYVDKDSYENNKIVETDIQAILTVLGRRKVRNSEINIDLNHTNLSSAVLSNANFSSAILFKVNLSNATLFKVNLFDAYLSGADLSGANLIGANLSAANLSNTHLHKADLSDANFSNAHLFKADLSHANLFNAKLFKANLSDANLSESKLSDADLSGANLSGANLSCANLSDAKLSDAHLSNADLRNVIFIAPWIGSESEGSIIDFIKELEKARNVFHIKLDDRIVEIIKEKFPDLYKRIKKREPR